MRRVLIISLTPVTDEPRVKRQAQALHEAGWDVSVAGFKGRDPAPEFWHLVEVPQAGVGLSARDAFLGKVDKVLSRISLKAAERAYWRTRNFESIYQQLAGLQPAEPDLDLLLGHDWEAAPIAARLSQDLDIPFSVDIHEYARGQYMDNFAWRLGMRPWIHAMQKRFLPQAAALTTICDGIADRLVAEYAVNRRPTVVRSLAQYVELPFRPTGERITVLYHGIVVPARGLEEAIRSVASWKPGLRLVIRGDGPPDYVAGLRSLAEGAGVSERVQIEGPVPASEMIRRAHDDADVGFFVQPDLSPQKRFTLPNKFFEYITAGLALCVADLPEMARFVTEHDLGVLVGDATPAAIVAAVNSMDADAIDRFKRNSLAAARVLDWRIEREQMLKLYDELVPAEPGRSP